MSIWSDVSAQTLSSPSKPIFECLVLICIQREKLCPVRRLRVRPRSGEKHPHLLSPSQCSSTVFGFSSTRNWWHGHIACPWLTSLRERQASFSPSSLSCRSAFGLLSLLRSVPARVPVHLSVCGAGQGPTWPSFSSCRPALPR